MHNSHKTSLAYIILFVIAIVYVTLFSFSTSFLYPHMAFVGNDSSQFLTIGKAWYLGKIPYRDMFDHKGPFIFFVDLIGFFITGGKTHFGVSIIQILFLFCTITAIYKISQLAHKSSFSGYICVFITLILMRNNYAEGNSVEEYCLPFICWSAYFLLRDLCSTDNFFDYRLGFLYGITAGICFLTRITNFIPLCGMLLIYIFTLIASKDFKCFFKSAITFILGMALVCCPFFIYFAYNNTLSEMFYASFTYNVEYALGMESWVLSRNLTTYFKAVFYFFLSFLLFPAGLLALSNNRKKIAVAYFLTCLVEVYFFTQGNAFVQYALVCTCQVPMFLNELTIRKTNSGKKNLLLKLLVFLFVLFLCVSCVQTLRTTYNRLKTDSSVDLAWDTLVKEIPEEDKNNIVLYGGNEFKGSYLAFDIMPCYKYHIIQEWHSNFSECVRNDIHASFETLDAKWILTDSNVNVISDILASSYSVYDQVDGYYLYKRN